MLQKLDIEDDGQERGLQFRSASFQEEPDQGHLLQPSFYWNSIKRRAVFFLIPFILVLSAGLALSQRNSLLAASLARRACAARRVAARWVAVPRRETRRLISRTDAAAIGDGGTTKEGARRACAGAGWWWPPFVLT